MIEHGMSEPDLKPAFVMLSSCETELCKRARTSSGGNTEASRAHLQKSCHWLQKVHGTDQLNAEPNQTNHSTLTPAPRLTPVSNFRTADHIRSAVPPEHIIDLSGDSPEKTPMSQKRISAIVPTSPSRLRALERELKVVCERETTVITQ